MLVSKLYQHSDQENLSLLAMVVNHGLSWRTYAQNSRKGHLPLCTSGSYDDAPSATIIMHLLPLCVLSGGYNKAPRATTMVPTSHYTHKSTGFLPEKIEAAGETVLFLLFCFRNLFFMENVAGEGNVVLHPPTRSKTPGSSGCNLNFGRKGQCDASWNLPKIYTNTQKYLAKSKLYTPWRKYNNVKLII